jgi:hypothetical protein
MGHSTEEATVALLQAVTDFIQVTGSHSQQTEQHMARLDDRLDQIMVLLGHPSSSPTSQPTRPVIQPPAVQPVEYHDTETTTPASDDAPHMDDLSSDQDSPSQGFFGSISDPFLAGIELVGVMVAFVSIALGLATLYIDPSGSEQAALEAALNVETTNLINDAEMYQHYRMYTSYALDSELQRQLETDLSTASEAEQSALQRELAAVSNQAATSRLFFPIRYLNRDGSYNTKRDIGEAWAQVSQTIDLNPQPHFVIADKLRAQSVQLMFLFIAIALAIMFCDIGQALHRTRKYMRRMTLSVILFLTLASVAVLVWIVFE